MVAATAFLDRGDEEFERFFEDEYARVVSIAYRVTRDRAEAEDAAQDVFVRAARSPRLRNRAWLSMAAVHTALNAIRSRKRRISRELRRVRLEHAVDESAGVDRDPQLIVQQQMQNDAVRAALLRLRPRDAQLLVLRHSGLSYRELAQAMSVDLAQVGTRLARAERAFKKEIERETL